MINEDEVVDILKQEGYVEVFPEQWDMATKIHAFHNATHIVGAIGGGMCNLLFSPSTTRSTVIVSPEFMVINNRFKYSMNHTDIKYEENTYLDSNKYIRVKVLQGEHEGKFGEIVDEHDKHYTISLGDDTSVSIQATTDTTINVPKDQVQLLDKGLNSPFLVNVESLKDTITTQQYTNNDSSSDSNVRHG